MVPEILDNPEERDNKNTLRRRATWVAKLVQDASDVVLILDLNGDILAVNDAAVKKYGYTHREVSYLNVRDLAPNRQMGWMATLLRHAAHGKPVESIQCQRVTKDGTRLDVWLTITPLRLDSDLPVAVMTTETSLSSQDSGSVVRAQLFNRLLQAQEEERRQLAHELHDEAGQLITALLRKVENVEHAESLEEVREGTPAIRELAEGILDELKQIARGLRPSELDVLGLNEALQGYITDFGRLYGIRVDVHLQGLDGRRLPTEIEVVLYRVVQETLTNTAKHAQADNISVVINSSVNQVSMIIEDDGHGFDVERVMQETEQTGTLGLHGIRERALSVGGEATIESSPGHGTSVYVTIPIPQ